MFWAIFLIAFQEQPPESRPDAIDRMVIGWRSKGKEHRR
jgi:hypothetical protein